MEHLSIDNENHSNEHEYLERLRKKVTLHSNRYKDTVYESRELEAANYEYPYPVVDSALWEYFMIHPGRAAWIVRRTALTSGSAVYAFYYTKEDTQSVFEFRPRMFNAERTLLYVMLSEDPNPPNLVARFQKALYDGLSEGINYDFRESEFELLGIIQTFAIGFKEWFYSEQEAQKFFVEAYRISTNITDKRSSGDSATIQFAGGDGLAIVAPPRVSKDLDTALRNRASLPGRGSHKSWEEDDWAWEQINVLNRPRQEVKTEWLTRISSGRPTLKDTARSFRHAIDPKRRGEGKSERIRNA